MAVVLPCALREAGSADALAEVLARRHPDTVGSLDDDEYAHARAFLAHFERIYTVNYDLLVYWTTMHEGTPAVPRNDGFSSSEEDPAAPWVAWNPTEVFGSQQVFYLHGALHLFDALAGRIDVMPKPFPSEFRADVVRVARASDLSMAAIVLWICPESTFLLTSDPFERGLGARARPIRGLADSPR